MDLSCWFLRFSIAFEAWIRMSLRMECGVNLYLHVRVVLSCEELFYRFFLRHPNNSLMTHEKYLVGIGLVLLYVAGM
jgi:hypothetical protein